MDGWAPLVALVLASAVLAAPMAAPAPQAVYPLNPRLFIATSATYAAAGDNVSLDFYTFSGGDPTDAASVPQTSPSSPFPGVTLVIRGMARVGTGHYRAWTILPSVPYGGLRLAPSALVLAWATVAGSNVSAGTALSWVVPGLFLRFYSNIGTVSLIQPMHLTAELYNGSQHADADAGTVHFQALTWTSQLGAPMTPNRTAIGVYEADVVLTSSMRGFRANATVHGVVVTQFLSQITFALPPWSPASYQAWFQTQATTATAVQGNLWVADPWGHAAPGVPVSLLIGRGPTTINGTTDAMGRFPLVVNLTGGRVQISGSVGGASPQAIAVYAILPSTPCAQGFRGPGSPFVTAVDPVVLPDGSYRDFLTPGTTATRKYHVINVSGSSGAPLTNAGVNYYVVGSNSGTVYAAGHAETDTTGNFSSSFVVPYERIAVLSDIAGEPVYNNGNTYSVASPLMGLQAGPLTLGGPTRIQVSFSSRATNWFGGGMALGIDSISVQSANGELWTDWGGSGSLCAEGVLRDATGGLNGTIFLPSFLPTNARYFLDAVAVVDGQLTEQFASLSPGQSVSTPVGGTAGLDLGTVLLWSAIGIVVAAIAAIGLWTVLRRKPKAPPQPPPGPPTS